MVSPAVELRDCSYTYPGAQQAALQQISLSQDAGEFLALMGRSGAGKSTLVRLLNGLIPGFTKGTLSGEVVVLGKPVKGRRTPEMAGEVGMAFQDFEAQLYSTLVELEVAFALENLGVERGQMEQRVSECLRLVGMDHLRGRHPATLSGGEKQRLAIASVLAADPALLVLDEPCTDLDPEGRQAALNVVGSLRERGRTILMVEHEADALTQANRVALLDAGRLVACDLAPRILGSVHLLEEHGVRPPQMADLFARLEVGAGEVVEDIETARTRLAHAGLRVSPTARTEATAGDAEKEESLGDEVIRVENLVHRYEGGPPAVDGASLSIREGDFVALIGRNGSGKTTLARHLNGLLRPTSGKATCFGLDTAKATALELARLVGYVFQNPDHQIFADTVRAELEFGPTNLGMAGDQIPKATHAAAEAVGLVGMWDRDPFSLAKGDRQRVAVASVLAARPKVLILDEPTTGLDYTSQLGMMELLRTLNQAGHTIICITHSMWVVAEWCRRTIVMDKGKVVADGPTRQVFSDEATCAKAGIVPPPIVRLSNRMGATALTVEELLRFIEGKGDASLSVH